MYWKRQPFVSVSTVAETACGRGIEAYTIGRGARRVLVTAGHHASEYLTSLLLYGAVEDYVNRIAGGDKEAQRLFGETTLTAVPCVDPDGVSLVTGLSTVCEVRRAKCLSRPDVPFPEGWKANLRGVDLNLNYPAGWEKARENKRKMGVSSPAPRDYVGCAPFSEAETRGLAALCCSFKPDAVCALHAQGGEIYCTFGDLCPAGTTVIAARLAAATGYSLLPTPEEAGYAGFKDWFIAAYDRPAFTVEMGCGENPLPIHDILTLLPLTDRLLAALLEP